MSAFVVSSAVCVDASYRAKSAEKLTLRDSETEEIYLGEPIHVGYSYDIASCIASYNWYRDDA